MNPQNKTRALAVRALIDLHQAHCCQKSKGSALFNLASATMIQLFAEKYTITPYGSFPNCKRAANSYGNESFSKLTTESGTNECSTVSIESSWRFPHMFSLSFVLAGDATRNKLCSKPFRDLITQILHFLPDQRKQRLEAALLRVPRAVEAGWDCHLHVSFRAGARFHHSWPKCDLTFMPWLQRESSSSRGWKGQLWKTGHGIHSLSVRSPVAWLRSEPECGTAPLSAREAISSCLPKDSSISHKPQNGSQKKGKKQLLRQNK